jgi:hypothetical protein
MLPTPVARSDDGTARGWRLRTRLARSVSVVSPARFTASFAASDRTYGARRVWHDLLAEGIPCGLHRIERLMRLQALKARPRRLRLPPDLGERQGRRRRSQRTRPQLRGTCCQPQMDR